MRTSDKQCDEQLLMQLSSDLDGAFESLVLAYQDRLYGFALRLLGNPGDAEEAAQDAFVRAYRALDRYEPERIRELALKPWIYQIALNVCRNRTRGLRLATVSLEAGERDDEDEGIDLPDDGELGPEARYERSEESARLASMVASLPERYRVPLVLRFVQDLSYAEIADVLSQPVGTVKSNVHRGIGQLRATMANSGSDEWDVRRRDNE